MEDESIHSSFRCLPILKGHLCETMPVCTFVVKLCKEPMEARLMQAALTLIVQAEIPQSPYR